MTDNTNRKLRKRRPPAYLVGDVKVLLPQNSDHDLYGYARPNSGKEYVSSAQELNSLAKVLSKFVNSANKRLLEKSNADQVKEERTIKSGPDINDEQSKRTPLAIDGAKRRLNQKTEIKDNNSRASKQVPPYRDQPQTSNPPKDKIKAQDTQKRDPSSNKFPKQPNTKNYNQSMGLMQMVQEFSQSKQGLNLGTLNKNSMDPIALALEQQQQILKYSPQLREKLQAQNNLQAKSQQGGEKYFRRSAYHIAIAYQIHLNNLRENGKDLQHPMVVDPTYFAKKLKGDYESKGNKGSEQSANQ